MARERATELEYLKWFRIEADFGPADGEDFLKATRYNFSNRARVYCMSGHNSYKYNKLCEDILSS